MDAGADPDTRHQTDDRDDWNLDRTRTNGAGDEMVALRPEGDGSLRRGDVDLHAHGRPQPGTPGSNELRIDEAARPRRDRRSDAAQHAARGARAEDDRR